MFEYGKHIFNFVKTEIYIIRMLRSIQIWKQQMQSLH